VERRRLPGCLRRQRRRVTTDEARAYCETNGVALVETSALDDSNVDLAFEQVR
jgi:Ras family